MGSAPPAPDPYATAQAQSGMNKETIIANANVSHVNQNTPFGSLKYTQTGTNSDGTPIWQSDVNLTPDMQKLLTQQTNNMNSQAGTAGSLLSNLGQQYAHPMDTSNLPGIASNVKIPGLQTGAQQVGPLQTSMGAVPGVNYSVADSGNVQGQVANSGNIQGQVASAPGINYGIADAGDIQKGVPGAGQNIQVLYNNGGDITRQGGAINGLQNQAAGAGSGIQYDVNGSGSYSQDARNAANDILSRNMPAYQYNDNLLRTRLQNQGITPGSEAWNREMQVQGQNFNDMLNQAQLQGYGIQNQLFNQGVTAAGVRNSAQNQNFQQNLANAGLNNEAARSMYEMTLGNNQFANQAQAQQNAQNLAAAQFANQGQNTAFNQQLAAANFGNTAQQQQFNQNAQRTDQANQAQQQQYNQNLGNAQFANQSQQQQYNQNLNNAQFANQAQNQNFTQNMDRTQLANQAQAQQYNQNSNTMQQNNAALLQQQGINQQNFQNYNNAQQALFGMGQQNAALQNAANAQQLQQNTQLYNQPMNTYNALMNGTQVQTPQFQSYQQGNAQAPNLMGMVQSNYGNQMGAYNNMMSGLFGLGGTAGTAALMMSDRRVKTDIRKVSVTPGGLNVYEFRYKGDDKLQTGVMADEVAKVRPDAVHIHESGYMMVDYRKVA